MLTDLAHVLVDERVRYRTDYRELDNDFSELDAYSDDVRMSLTNCEAELERWKTVAIGAVKDTERVIEDCDRLRDRLAALEAPPVVPRGWEGFGMEDDNLWALRGEGTNPTRAVAHRALAWAIEHDERPPHEDDKP